MFVAGMTGHANDLHGVSLSCLKDVAIVNPIVALFPADRPTSCCTLLPALLALHDVTTFLCYMPLLVSASHSLLQHG